jgi:hypothetical protein
MLSFAANPPNEMTHSVADSPGDSSLVSKPMGPLRGNAAAANMPLAPAALAKWAIATSPNTSATDRDYLTGVTCASASECWAVGSYFDSDISGNYTLIEQWDGTSWSIATSPNPNTGSDGLTGVTCASASDCWAVGHTYPQTGNDYKTLIEHWDGTSWSIVGSPNTFSRDDDYLNAVTCASASDCWAVGWYASYNLGGLGQTLIEHWDGTSWAIATSPNTSTTDSDYLTGVTCASASECWAVGDYAPSTGSLETLIEHWDGTSWSIVTSPNTSNVDHLNAVACASASDCWAVGYYSNSSATQTLIEQWDGTSWSIVTSPNEDEESSLYGVTCVSASDCWAVGIDINGVLIEQWNGTSWSIVTSPSPDNGSFLQGVTCVSASDCWAVGAVNNTPTAQTLIEQYTTSAVTITTSASPSNGGTTSGGNTSNARTFTINP